MNGDAEIDFVYDLPPITEPRFWEAAPGQRVAWNEYGDPDGKPVMYYHGWPSSRLQARLAHHLARERGLRLIAMDRPGMGRSDFEAARTLGSWTRLMTGFADALGIDRFAQLAVSGGGPYALACAAEIPGRLTGTSVLAGAVPLAELSPRALKGLHPLYRLLMPFRNWSGCLFTPLFRMAAWSTALPPGRFPLSLILKSLPDADQDLLLHNPTTWNAVTASFCEGVVPGGGRCVMADAAIYFQATHLDLTGINHPIRYWHGTLDKNIPIEMVREFVGKIPSAALEECTTLGHFSCVLGMAPAALDHLAQAIG